MDRVALGSHCASRTRPRTGPSPGISSGRHGIAQAGPGLGRPGSGPCQPGVGQGVVVGPGPALVPSRPAPAGFARSSGDLRARLPGARSRRSPDDLDTHPRGLSDDLATRAEPPARRCGRGERRGPVRRPVREADADERTGARPRTRTGTATRRTAVPRPEPPARGPRARRRASPRRTAMCTGATSDHPPPRPARLLRPFRSATSLHPSLYEEKGRSGGAGGVAE